MPTQYEIEKAKQREKLARATAEGSIQPYQGMNPVGLAGQVIAALIGKAGQSAAQGDLERLQEEQRKQYQQDLSGALSAGQSLGVLAPGVDPKEMTVQALMGSESPDLKEMGNKLFMHQMTATPGVTYGKPYVDPETGITYQQASTGKIEKVSEAPKKSERIGTIDPEKWTVQSIDRFAKTGNYSDLKPAKAVSVKAPAELFKDENTLRDEYVNQSKEFVDVSNAYRRILASNEDPSAAGDLALIFNYMKMLDPGSVVRESEFATAENAASVPERIRGLWNKTLSGEKLLPDRRADFVKRADKLYAGQLVGHSKLQKTYTDMAQRYGLDPANVVLNYNIDEEKRPKFGTAPPNAIDEVTPKPASQMTDDELRQAHQGLKQRNKSLWEKMTEGLSHGN